MAWMRWLPWRRADASDAAPPLSWRSTAMEALQASGADLSGRVAIVTGGNAGIGRETVRVLAAAGATVVLACRNPAAGQAAAAEIQPAVEGSICVMQLDLASLASIARFAEAFTAAHARLDLLLLSAGVMALPERQATADGFEMQFGTNYVGHWYLTHLLLPWMRAHGAPARVISVSSIAHTMHSGSLDLEDLGWQRRAYRPWPAYSASKLASILHAKELARRLAGGEGRAPRVTACALHPGMIRTGLTRHMRATDLVPQLAYLLWSKSVEQGAATSVWAAVAPGLEAHSGAYLADCQVAEPSAEARDAELAAALWAKTEELLAPALAAAGLPAL